MRAPGPLAATLCVINLLLARHPTGTCSSVAGAPARARLAYLDGIWWPEVGAPGRLVGRRAAAQDESNQQQIINRNRNYQGE